MVKLPKKKITMPIYYSISDKGKVIIDADGMQQELEEQLTSLEEEGFIVFNRYDEEDEDD